MNKLHTLLIGLTLIASAVHAGEQEARSFFDAAKKGDYKAMFQLVKSARFTPQEITLSRDSQGNTFLTAALLGYLPALRQHGASTEQILFDTFALLFAKLSKQDALKLVSTENNAGDTALFLAAKLGLLKVTWLLHDKGALSAIGTKKASSVTPNAQLRTVLLGWENLEGDWVDLGTPKK